MNSVTFELSDDDLVGIDEIATDRAVDRGIILREAVADYLAEQEDLRHALDQAEEDIREGRTLSHEEVMAHFRARFVANAA